MTVVSFPPPHELVGSQRGARAGGEHPAYSAEELRNLAVVTDFRAAAFADRAQFLASDVRVARIGMSTLATTSGLGSSGYQHDSLTGREDTLLSLVARDDVVWGVWTLTAAHTGTLFGIPATGRTVSITEVGIWRLTDGLIAEHWYFADELELLHQLGLYPPPRVDDDAEQRNDS